MEKENEKTIHREETNLKRKSLKKINSLVKKAAVNDH